MNKSIKLEQELEEIKKWSKGLEKIAEKIECHFATMLTFKRAIQYLSR